MLCYIIVALYFCLPNLSGHGASFSSKRTRFQMPRGDALGGQTFVSQAMPSDSSWVCTCGLQVVIVCPVLHLFVWILPCRAPKLLRLCVKSVFAGFFLNPFHWCVVLTVCGFLWFGIGGPASTAGSPIGRFWIGARGSPCTGQRQRIQWVYGKAMACQTCLKFPNLLFSEKCPHIFTRLACLVYHFNEWVRTRQNILEQIDSPLDRGQLIDPIDTC